jgi:CRP-like cAMP-binding protein
VISRQGDPVEVFYKLVSGRLQARVVPGGDGVPDDLEIDRHARPVAVVSCPGDMPGESGALLERRVCSLVAETEVTLEVTRAPAERLSQMVLERPALGLALAEGLARRLAEAACGLALLDGRLSEIGREVDRHEAALDRLVNDLAAPRGGLARVAARAREAAALRRSGTDGARGRPSRRSPRSRLSERRRTAEAVLEFAGAGSGDAVELAAGQWLCREGEIVPSASGRKGGAAPFFLVLAGELEIVARGRRLGRARENELAGELAAVLPGLRRRPFAIRATRPSRALCIPGDRLGSLAEARPALAVHLVRVLSRRLERAYRALADVQEELSAAAGRIDPRGQSPCAASRGPERSLASDFAALGADLAGWAEDAPEGVRDVGRHLAAIRGCARDAREEESDFESAFLGGAPFRDLLARREFARAGRHLRRAFDRLRGRGESGGAADASEDIRTAAEAVYDYAGVGSGKHPGGVGSAEDVGKDSSRGRPGRADLEGHSVGTAARALLIAERIGCGVREVRELALAALLHDVGMLRAETGVDFLMEAHPTEYAVSYLARLKGLPPVVVPAVCQHHEFVDGSGYPRRLSGERMCLGGKVLSVANQLDLLLAKGLSPEEVAGALSAEASRYDPACLSAALEVIADGRAAADRPELHGEAGG